MTDYQILDNPVDGAEWDLLGMSVYAAQLARYISSQETQFTLGVYGQWGEGKTSFVHLLRDELCEQTGPAVVFIEFSAWPYATAEDLWRALIKTIADDLCGKLAAKSNKQPTFKEQLKSSALTVAVRKQAEAEPSAADEAKTRKKLGCQDLRSWADQAAQSGISKGTDEQLQINQEVAMMAMARAGVEALSMVSPLVRAVRSFLGIKTELDMTAVFQKEKSEVKKENIDSIQLLQQRGRALFDDIKEGRRVYVFVDDLDRCLPDVALDLLEAIKNFLNVGLTFIVAADQELIGQGLRLRYKELVSSDSGDDLDKYIAKKGREYFEKIIQFGVPVPTRTPEQAHHFITAQFPQWQPATDIIQTALGTNPRRLKQYCNLLSYKRLVGDVPLSISERDKRDSLLVGDGTRQNGRTNPAGGQPAPLIITPELYESLKVDIQSCLDPNNFLADLSTIFLDVRIRQWRGDLPADPTFSLNEVIQSTIDLLIDSTNEQGQNGLLLFLNVLKEKGTGQACAEYLDASLNELVALQSQELPNG